MTAGGLLVAGASSDAGKSFVTAGICRLLRRKGFAVAPFKAQNMSNNSVVTLDGGEIGRSQALQARACGLEPSVAFNPVLLKPGSDAHSQLVVRGRVSPDTPEVSATDYARRKSALASVVGEDLHALRERFDVVICEGAGSAAEINLRHSDLANFGLARAAELPVLVVADIDRGGVFAHLFGTLALLEPADQRLLAGFVINKFRGDPALLYPGVSQLQQLTGRPTYGVLPFDDRLWLDAEDSLQVVADGVLGRPAHPVGSDWLRVAVPRLPRISNSTDAEALAAEPGVLVRYVTEPSRIADADLVLLPGSKATVADLEWLQRTGIATALDAHAAAGGPILGICGGFQMLCEQITDEVESGSGRRPGLGMLRSGICFDQDKTLQRPEGRLWGRPVNGYEIHHGRQQQRGEPLLQLADGGGEGELRGAVAGTHWHGLLENDEARRAILLWAAEHAGRRGFVPAPQTDFHAQREAQLDLLADIVEAGMDTSELLALTEHGPPSLPAIGPGPPRPAAP